MLIKPNGLKAERGIIDKYELIHVLPRNTLDSETIDAYEAWVSKCHETTDRTAYERDSPYCCLAR